MSTPDPTTSVRHRAKRRRAGTWLTAALLLIPALCSLGMLPFSYRWYNVQAVDWAVRHRPAWSPVVPYAVYRSELDRCRAPTWAMACAPLAHRSTSWLGHDDLGRSLFMRLTLGFALSLVLGVLAAAVSTGIGVPWGAMSAILGGRFDALLMRIVDVLYGLPYVLVVIVLRIALTRPLTLLMPHRTEVVHFVILLLAVGTVSWLTMARVVRGQVLSLRGRAFIDAARSMGAGPWHILTRHVAPNLVGPILVCATLVVPQAILQESLLSFLGIGIQQPLPSLGRLAADGISAVNKYVGFWWLLLSPCLTLVVMLVVLNRIGDRVRDALDPRSRAAGLV